MLDKVPLASGIALVRMHRELLRANITGPLEISDGVDSSIGQEVTVDTVGIVVGELVGPSVPSAITISVSPSVGEIVGTVVW